MSAHPNSDSHDIAWAGHAKDVPITGDGFETTTALAISAADAPRTPLPAVGTSMGDCAVHYGGVLGFEVFPAPFGLKESHKSAEFSDGRRWGATTEATEIRHDFKRWHDDEPDFKANIGIATGIGSGVFVIETDTAEGHGEGVDGAASLAAFEAKLGALPPTLMAISPSGSVHRYFTHPGIGIKVVSRSNIMPGVDCKGDLGMVIVPPSVMPTVERADKPRKPGGTYRWLNDLRVADAPRSLLDIVCEESLLDSCAATTAPPPATKAPPPATLTRDGTAALVWPKVGSFLAAFPTDGETLAMLNLSRWVPALLPPAEPKNGGYRITSASLGRDLQEDLSIMPNGIKDWGVRDMGDPREGRRTPIELIMEYSLQFLGQSKTASEAADWLHAQMGVPAERQLCWRTGEQEDEADVTPPADSNNVDPPAPARQPIHATPYVWKDPATIPRREWLYGRLLLRKFVTATISPGGIGKSSLIAAEALAMVSGKALLEVSPEQKLKVWLWNLEDPQEETERKIQAAAIHYHMSPDDIGDRLLVDSGRDQRLVIAVTERNGAVIVQPVVDDLVAEIIARKIDVIVIDPFVSCHEVAENDNPAMDRVVKEWGKVADRGNCAVHLVDHTRKMGDATEVTTESSRGGSAKTDACRVVRAVNRMSEKQATDAGVDNHRLYFRTYNDKGNLQPPADGSDWFKLESVDLRNGPMGMPGDSVGVVIRWDWPDLTAGMTVADYDRVAAVIKGGKWKASIQAKNWAGIAVAEALGLNTKDADDKAKIKAALKMYLKAGTLVEVERLDSERREMKLFVEVPDKV